MSWGYSLTEFIFICFCYFPTSLDEIDFNESVMTHVNKSLNTIIWDITNHWEKEVTKH